MTNTSGTHATSSPMFSKGKWPADQLRPRPHDCNTEIVHLLLGWDNV
ncbi:hypothetical protein [Streptomyces rugosispiralis]|uniref:Uncharacterized protein n=1 Tax=Streptomyces rugosispiralis TaxID=2967341 RepID=A0ABT1V1J2_9ACTN|nr:hypothetical protein [Streptomyces rugosispiralis]MCQ8190620.1 hypothetical protein [Streptomyces rugosispiralis]